MKRPFKGTVEQDIDFLRAFACDTIASYSISNEYDRKDVAYAIERLFGQFPEISYSVIEDPDFGYPFEDEEGVQP